MFMPVGLKNLIYRFKIIGLRYLNDFGSISEIRMRYLGILVGLGIPEHFALCQILATFAD